MPLATEQKRNSMRVCIYGHPKSYKTTWALQAAESGYRVLMFDGEKGSDVVARLSPEAQQRVYILNVFDGVEPLDAFFARAIVSAFKTYDFYIDEEKRLVSPTPRAGFTHINMREFSDDTVVVVDSYTALKDSLNKNYAGDNNIDITDAKKVDWEGYRWVGAMLTWFLKQVMVTPCHLVMTGHATQYEKFKKDPMNPQKQGPLEFSRRQLVSSSNPHGMAIGQYFSDILYASVQGRTAYVDSRGNQFEEGGSRAIEPKQYPMSEMSFGHLAMAHGFTLPESAAPWAFETHAAAPIIQKTAPTTQNALQSRRSSVLFQKK